MLFGAHDSGASPALIHGLGFGAKGSGHVFRRML